MKEALGKVSRMSPAGNGGVTTDDGIDVSLYAAVIGEAGYTRLEIGDRVGVMFEPSLGNSKRMVAKKVWRSS